MIRFNIKLSKLKLESNYGIVKNIIKIRPGLRFHEIKKETNPGAAPGERPPPLVDSELEQQRGEPLGRL